MFQKYKEQTLIMGGHFADDLCQGSLPAILTFMYQEGILQSFEQVALLIMASTAINALAQPLAGLLADKKPRPYLMCLGMLLAALGIMFTGLIDNLWLLMLLLAINGIGVALFHPAAGKLARLFSAQSQGRGMSIFQVGGSIGFAVGPLYLTAAYTLMGLQATLTLCLPAIIMACVFIRRNALYTKAAAQEQLAQQRKQAQGQAAKENYPGILLVLLLVFARSAAMFGLTSFLPLYLIHVLNQEETLATASNALIAGSGIIAVLGGGILSDKFGFSVLTKLASLAAVPCIIAFTLCNDVPLSLICLIGFALCYYAAMSPIVVIGQSMLSRHVGMATGITIGLGISFGGIAAPLLGKLGDSLGLDATMYAIAALSTLAALISFCLPRRP